MLSKESFSAHPSLHPVQFPNTLFFSKPSFHPGQIQKRTFYHNIPTRANPKRILLSQHSIQGSSKKNTFITTFLPSRVVPKAILYFYYNLPSIQSSSKKNSFILQPSFHPGQFQKEYFYHNLPSIQGSSRAIP